MMQVGWLDQFLEQAAFYFQTGGYIMPPLVLATLLLWFGIGYRAAALRRGSRHSVRALVDKHLIHHVIDQPQGMIDDAVKRGVELYRRGAPFLRRQLDDAFGDYKPELKRHNRLIKTIVTVAPILGLLGTVVGMIETFDSLGDMKLFSQSGGIAGGISQALFTTQLGLAVAIPGLIVKGFLDRKQRRIEREIEQVKNILCSRLLPGEE